MKNPFRRLWDWIKCKDLVEKYKAESEKFLEINEEIAEHSHMAIDESNQSLAAKPLAEVLHEVRRDIVSEKNKEQQIRKQYFPEPTSKRLTKTRTRQPPAEQHRDAISKHMKGKGRSSVRYRRMIKESPKVRIEEEEN